MNNKQEIDENHDLKFDFYETITFCIILFIIFLSHYSFFTNIFNPLLIFLAIFFLRFFKYKYFCSGKYLSIYSIFDRCLFLFCIYLYCEYTVKCIPMLNLLFYRVFEYPITGTVIKSAFSFFIMNLADYIINRYQQTSNFNTKMCSINNFNINTTALIFICIVLNTYLDKYKQYTQNRLLTFQPIIY